jgi:hypothetical protein
VKLDQKVTGIFPTGAVAGRIETIRMRLVGGISYVAMSRLHGQIAEGPVEVAVAMRKRWGRR